MQDYLLEETPRMTLFTALNRIREELDPSLQFDFVCRSAICGSCAMLINGRPGLACQTLTHDLPDKITLLPLPVFRLVGDLSVDTGTWFRHLTSGPSPGSTPTSPSTPRPRKSACPTTRRWPSTSRALHRVRLLHRRLRHRQHAAGLHRRGGVLNRIARFLIDPRDQRADADYFEVVGTDEGVFGCIGLLACEDFCPMEIPLQDQLAFVRRKMARAALKCARCK